METKIRILHIDDNIHDRQLVKDALLKEHNEFEVIEADNREKFEQLITENNFDLVLSDFNILGFDGLQVLQAVKNVNPDLPVIIVTGTGSEEVAINAMKMGAADYVIKTVKHIQGLVPTINIVLQHKKVQEEHRLAMIALNESEELFRTAFESAVIGVVMISQEGNFISVNSTFCKILGYSKDELLQFTFRDITYKEDVNISYKLQQQLIAGEINSAIFEKRYIHKSGHLVWVNISIGIVHKPKNNLKYFVSYIQDITERKLIEENLHRSEQLFKSLAETAPVGIFRTDPSGSTTYVNPRWCEISKINYNEALGNGWFGAVHPDDRSFLTKHWQEDVMNKTSSEAEYRFLRKDGSISWVSGRAVPQKDENGVVIGYIGIAVDITARKQAELELIKAKEKAEESDRLKTAFLHNISHEIRTPMNAIMGFSEILNERDMVFEERKELTKIIIQNSKQLLSIITDIISISSIEAGQEKIHEIAINLNSTLKDIYDQFTSTAQEKTISFNLTIPLPDFETNIFADQIKLTQIISKLLDNAFKFTRKGVINWGYNLKDSHLEFYIEDSGIGIPSDMNSEIFKRFRQADFTADQLYGGSGLGLTIAKAYVELFGGKIWVNSEFGKGSVFYFTIPFKKSNLSDLSIKQSPLGSKNDFITNKILLIAEDENYNFMLVKELLSKSNFKIIRAMNGMDAVEICKANAQIDLVLMDLKMPLMDGFEATRQIKIFRPDLPVVALSAYSTDIDRNKATISGCSDFISKPFQKTQIINSITKLILC